MNTIRGLTKRRRTIWAATLLVLGILLSQPAQAFAQQTIADPSPQGSLRFITTHSGSGNLYTYHRITPPVGYVVATGDYLEYEVYCSLANTNGVCDGGAEIDFSDLTSLRALGNTDQNGITSTWGDISAYAKGRWYHRKISLAGAVGKTIAYVSLVEETDNPGSYANYYRGISITNGTGIKSVIWDTGVPAFNALFYGAGSSGSDASGSYFDEIYVAGSGNSYLGGKVGIGTASPQAPLHISGQVSSEVLRLQARTDVSNNGSFMTFYTSNPNYWWEIWNADASSGSSTNDLRFRARQGSGSAIEYLSMIGATGNVGIGTISPLTRLDVKVASNFHFGTVYSTPNATSIGAFNDGFSAWQPLSINPGGQVWLMGGNVGIGTTNPQAKLHVAGTVATGALTVTGNITATGSVSATYQDVAEWVPASRAIAAGTVVVLDAERSNHVLPSTHTYDTRVAGVVSASPGVILGEGGEGKVMVATTGRVRVKVDATNAPIRVGDLLVTSDKEGIAMRSQPLDLDGTPIHRPGTLIGKALEPLAKGAGEILVLLSLQ